MNKRLLFVDDELPALDALRRTLHAQRHSWNITWLDDSGKAWEQLQTGRFDVVVSDIRMPGMRICIESRIVAVADVFDALTSPRPYKAAYSEADALRIMEETVGSHFDTTVYAAFRHSLPAIRSVRRQFPDDKFCSLTLEESCNETHLVCGR